VVSGPAVQDRTFFMAGWESQRDVREAAGTNIVLTPEQRRGDFSATSARITDPFSGDQFPKNECSSETRPTSDRAMVMWFPPTSPPERAGAPPDSAPPVAGPVVSRPT
jgi:hypothetical protein